MNDNSSFLIAGIDPGSQKTGYAFLEVSGRNIQPVSYGVISTSRHKNQPDKLVHIHQELRSLIERYRPTEAAVEDIFHQKNVRSAFKLGQTRGAIILTLALCGVEVYSYPPAVIKKAVTAYGRADKHQVLSMVKAILDLPKSPQVDAADALAIALTHSQTIQYRRL